MNLISRHATLPIIALGALALSACGDRGDTVKAENESVESVARKVQAANIRPLPGRWETQLKMDKLEIAGMPPEMQGMMKQQFDKLQTSVSCLTKEDVERADGEMFKPESQSGCTYRKFSMGDGKIEADMTCEGDGMAQKMTMAGTYSQQAYAMQINADGNVQGQPMSMAMSVNAKRVGECDGNEEG